MFTATRVRFCTLHGAVTSDCEARTASLEGMSSQKSAVLRARSAFGGLIAGLIVTLLWPIVTATFVLNAWDPDDTCARVQSSGDRVRYDFFPPRMLCSTGPDAWASVTAEGVTIGLSVVLVLGVASMIIGVIAGVWSVPRVAPAASGVNFAYVAGTLPPLRHTVGDRHLPDNRAAVIGGSGTRAAAGAAAHRAADRTIDGSVGRRARATVRGVRHPDDRTIRTDLPGGARWVDRASAHAKPVRGQIISEAQRRSCAQHR